MIVGQFSHSFTSDLKFGTLIYMYAPIAVVGSEILQKSLETVQTVAAAPEAPCSVIAYCIYATALHAQTAALVQL